MVSVFLILALLFGGVAAWGARGMLQVVRKRNEFDGAGDGKAAQGRTGW